MNLAVIGLQFGDEGKGKIVDYLSESFDIVARYSGGSNAGHTVIYNGNKIHLHLIPSGIFQGKKCVLGSGMVIDMVQLMDEWSEVKEYGASGDILISTRAHIVTSLHKKMDALEDRKRNIGTTKRGIGPAYETKMKRIGIRVHELFDADAVAKKMRIMAEMWNMDVSVKEIQREAEEIHYAAKYFKSNIVDTEIWLNRAIDDGKTVLFEGSQGAMLDIDFGTYPYVTSAVTLPGGASTGLGIPPRFVHRVLGVIKAYSTRVGEGPFPTEIHGADAEKLRDAGGEYGATTGRPRRVGWMDLVLVRYSVMLSGADELALTKVDVLKGYDKIRVAVAYERDGKKMLYPPANIENCKPVYVEMNGWSDITDDAFRQFVELIERETKAKVKMVSYGREREKTMLFKK